jgi:pescadillo protein
MPKAKFAHRGKPKLKSIKSKKVLNEKRQESRFGKKQKKGHAGVAVEYVGRTRAVKDLQLSIADFRRLCILKGIYPRDPPNKRSLDVKQSYYHHKDISYLRHEPLMKKFRETKAFLKKLKKAIGRRELSDARRMYEQKPVYTLDHIIKARYPRFTDALNDLDDALSGTHLFAGFPADEPIKTEHTALAKRLCREWQYYVARTRSLRKVFFSIKGCYFQADVRGVTVTWMQPWKFSQALPDDVDYKVMLTFLELHSVLIEFTHFKLFSDLGLAYPPGLRADLDAEGAHLSALDVATAAAAAKAEADKRAEDEAALARSIQNGTVVSAVAPVTSASGGKGKGTSGVIVSTSTSTTLTIPNEDEAAKLLSLKRKLKQIVRTAGTTGDGSINNSSTSTSSSSAAAAAVSAAIVEEEQALTKQVHSRYQQAALSRFDFVDADVDEEESQEGGSSMRDMAEFAENPEAKAAIEQARKLVQFKSLFRGLVFFLSREVPRELLEFIVCSFRGRVGWEGPGSPYLINDSRITHQVVDRPVVAASTEKSAASTVIAGREYIQPQWIVDSINARMLLPITRYAPGAVLPPHLSPFVDDAKEGYIPAYRNEIDRLRAAAAVTGRLADIIATAQNEAVELTKANKEKEAQKDDEDEEEEEEDDDDDDGDEDDEEEEEEEEEEEDVEALLREAESAAGEKGQGGSSQHQKKRAKLDSSTSAPSSAAMKAGIKLSKAETERREMAASMLTSTQRRNYNALEAKRAAAEQKAETLEEKRKQALKKGDSGLGVAKPTNTSSSVQAVVKDQAVSSKKRARS